MNVAFEWKNPEQLLAQVRKMLRERAGGIQAVPEAAIRRGVFELLRLVQKRLPKKTSTLVRSVHAVVERISADLIAGRVGTWLAYGRYLEEGTGIYGPKQRPILITAKTKQGLFWGAYDENGSPIVRKRVVVKGIQPRNDWAAAIQEFLPRYVEIIREELRKAAA